MKRRDFLKLSAGALALSAIRPQPIYPQATGGAYYLAPLIPVTRGRSPVGADTTESNWILLDNDEALLWLKDPVADARVVKLADDKAETLAVATRARLTTLSGDRPYRGTDSFQAVVTGLLMTAPAGRWNAIKPSKTRQQQEIWLGPGGAGNNLFFAEAATLGPNSKTFVDSFDRANANLNASTSSDGLFTWLEVDGTTWTVASNEAQCNGNVGFNTARANADLDTDDHYAQAVIATFTHVTANLVCGCLVRWTSGANGYGLEVGLDGLVAGQRRTYRYDTDANLASDTGTTTSGTVYLEADGSSITAKVNAVNILGPTTNTAFTGQLRTGIVMFSDGGNSLALDNFQTGDLAAGAAVRPRGVITFN